MKRLWLLVFLLVLCILSFCGWADADELNVNVSGSLGVYSYPGETFLRSLGNDDHIKENEYVSISIRVKNTGITNQSYQNVYFRVDNGEKLFWAGLQLQSGEEKDCHIWYDNTQKFCQGTHRYAFYVENVLVYSTTLTINSNAKEASPLPPISQAEYAEPDWDGSFKIRNVADGTWLSHQNNTLTVTANDPGDNGVWHIREAHVDYNDPYSNRILYVIQVPDSEMRMDIKSGEWSSIIDLRLNNRTGNLWTDSIVTGGQSQHWYIEPRADDVVAFASFANIDYMMGMHNGKPVISERDNSLAQQWILIPCNDIKTLYSTDRTVVMHLPPEINQTISDKELIVLADKWAKAYRSLIHLHAGKEPYNRIIFECNEQPHNNAYAYVWGWGDNHIYWPKQYFVPAMQMFQQRDNDWSFGALHEIGHLFDSNAVWDFDTEVLTDVCIVYELEAYNGRANQANEIITYDARGVQDGFTNVSLRNGYDIFGAVGLILQIKDGIGWGPFIDAFRIMEADKTSTQIRASRIEKFDYFISVLSKCAGCDVTQFVSTEDYQLLRGYYSDMK